jgi:hypothetical protein
MLLCLYWGFIPRYCSDLIECRLNPSITSGAYGWFFTILIILMVATNILKSINCPSENKLANIGYSVFITLACWSIFLFIVYGREYLRMSFANVFGYLWISKKATDIITKIIPKNLVDVEELLREIKKEPPNNKTNQELVQKLIQSIPKTRIDDNFELLTYLRSGTNYVPGLIYIKDFTNKVFTEKVEKAINDGVDAVKKNDDLIELLNVLYIRDVIGEIILFVLAGVMCSYLSEYLIQKINCSYKTPQEIEKRIDEYNAEYNKQQQMENKQIVVTQ